MTRTQNDGETLSQEDDSHTEATPSVEMKDSQQEALESALKKAEDLQTRLLYLQAEFENYKKRMAKERAELIQYAGENTIKRFLPTIDTLGLAIESAKRAAPSVEGLNSIVSGVEMTFKSLISVFEGLGCQFVESVGQPFDPNVHEAVMHRDSADVPENSVLQEFEKGCLLQGKLIRPAKVVVSKKA